MKRMKRFYSFILFQLIKVLSVLSFDVGRLRQETGGATRLILSQLLRDSAWLYEVLKKECIKVTNELIDESTRKLAESDRVLKVKENELTKARNEPPTTEPKNPTQSTGSRASQHRRFSKPQDIGNA